MKPWPLCVIIRERRRARRASRSHRGAKLIIQMAKMINLRARHLHVQIHLPPAARRLGRSGFVSAGGESSSVNSFSGRLCCWFLQDQRPQDGTSCENLHNRDLIFKEPAVNPECEAPSAKEKDRPHLSAPHLTWADTVSDIWIYCGWAGGCLMQGSFIGAAADFIQIQTRAKWKTKSLAQAAYVNIHD